jgi:hypothetical protein
MPNCSIRKRVMRLSIFKFQNFNVKVGKRNRILKKISLYRKIKVLLPLKKTLYRIKWRKNHFYANKRQSYKNLGL